jgi:DNA-binding response OmpR family regulator
MNCAIPLASAQDLILARLAALEVENALLQRLLFAPADGWSGAFRLPRIEYVIVSALARAEPRAVRTDFLVELWDAFEVIDATGLVHTHVSKARARLRPSGVEIKTERNIGYWMTLENAARFEALLREPT